MSKFKAGDMAIVVGCRKYPVNIGKVVTLEVLLSPSESIVVKGLRHNNREDIPLWIVSGEGLMAVLSRLGDKWIGSSKTNMVAEAYLMPLNGDPEQFKDEESNAGRYDRGGVMCNWTKSMRFVVSRLGSKRGFIQ